MGAALQNLGERASLANSGSTGHTGWRLLLTQVHNTSALASAGMQPECQACKSRLCQLHTCILRAPNLPLILHRA